MPIQVLMPALSPTMTEGKLAKWLKAEGDTVASGDVLAEIETDKATMEIEAVEEGVLARILVAEGTEGVPINQPIALILEEGEDASALDAAVAAAPVPAPPPVPATPAAAPEPAMAAAAAPAPQTAPAAAPASLAAPVAGERVFASPLARRMAKQAGLDLSAMSGSGPKGRIVKTDIEAALAGGAPGGAPVAAPAPALAPAAAVVAPALPGGPAFTEVPHSTMRKIIARRLTEAKQTVPHFYLTMDCEIDRLLAARREINAASPEGEGAYKVSVNDMVIKAVAQALRRMPEVNASWTETGLRRYATVDVSIAVATEGGLITPIVRDADRKGLAAIANEMKDLAARGRAGKLMPEEYQGGGFSISNLGMFGVREFAAIINPPQSCILAVGAGAERPVVKDGALAVATVMSCTLSCDHRVVDGALGARFLQVVKGFLESPATMLA